LIERISGNGHQRRKADYQFSFEVPKVQGNYGKLRAAAEEKTASDSGGLKRPLLLERPSFHHFMP
jgi:hypothetical protein